MSYLRRKSPGGVDVNVAIGNPVPNAPMILDIAAIQWLYGARADANIEDNQYEFEVINGWPVKAIWDAGGNDTIDASEQTAKVTIDLNPGGISFVDSGGSLRAEIHAGLTPQRRLFDSANDIEWAATELHYLENATGGNDDDTIIGNEVANVLIGGEDGDNIAGGDGNDQLIGGAGNDKVCENRGLTSRRRAADQDSYHQRRRDACRAHECMDSPTVATIRPDARIHRELAAIHTRKSPEKPGRLTTVRSRQ